PQSVSSAARGPPSLALIRWPTHRRCTDRKVLSRAERSTDGGVRPWGNGVLMRFRLVFLGLFLLLIGGCGPKSAPSITLATTTSVQDTGLLDRLLPMFREETGIEVKVVAVGTGQALELGRRGDADVLIVHDPESEKQFMDEGHGELRRQIMHNDFVIVGPRTDPAGLRSMKLRFAAAAFQHIAMVQATFVSRGDE